MNDLWDIDIFEMNWLENLSKNNMPINILDLRTIEKQDREYHILKRTSVLLMPRWQKFQCTNLEQLIRALKIEKVWFRFNEEMETVRMAEIALNEQYDHNRFVDHVLRLAVRDFKNGNDREDIVIKWLEERGWYIEPYSDSTAYKNEVRGIDIVCSKGSDMRCIQVKSGGFGFAPDITQFKQLKKMVDNNCFLAIVNQKRNNALTIFNPVEVKEWFDSVKGRLNV